MREKQAEVSIIWPSTLFLWLNLCHKPLINICRRTKNSSRTTSLWNIIRSFIWINVPSKLNDTWQLLLFRIVLLTCFVVFTRFHKYETVSKVVETTFDKSSMPVKSMQPSFFRQIKTEYFAGLWIRRWRFSNLHVTYEIYEKKQRKWKCECKSLLLSMLMLELITNFTVRANPGII